MQVDGMCNVWLDVNGKVADGRKMLTCSRVWPVNDTSAVVTTEDQIALGCEELDGKIDISLESSLVWRFESARRNVPELDLCTREQGMVRHPL